MKRTPSICTSDEIDDARKEKKSKTGENSSDKNSSSVLQCIIGKQNTIDSFFRDQFQTCPSMYHVERSIAASISPVLESVYSMGWDGVSRILHKSQSYFNSGEDLESTYLPILFLDQEPVSLDAIKSTYGNSPFAAFLDGCSIVHNHADLMSPSLAALCLDLQKSLPHAYVNTYLTPPNAAAVNAHADDRDVFVIQILGEKRWKVYGEVPIPYPSANEQVGKNNLPVPTNILNKKPLYEVVLKQGDVIYMPRGFVHEACTSSEPSFHATVALATHDWSVSKTIADMVTKQLQLSSKFRMAVHPEFGMRDLDCVGADFKEKTNRLLGEAMDQISSKISLEGISSHLCLKYKTHNEFVQNKRQKLLDDDADFNISTNILSNVVVGPEAAQQITMKSNVRAGTPIEKENVPPPVATHGRGLIVREDTRDALIGILGILKTNKHKSFKVCALCQEIFDSDCVDMVCDLTILSFVKCCVELGAMALVID
mmetsp:Transcript_42487/g.83520  ORF Transcript_42487/g.83520 Transcript_42487/m.83520 type:complete len:484 (-) Transcript_42487:7-1458(-)